MNSSLLEKIKLLQLYFALVKSKKLSDIINFVLTIFTINFNHKIRNLLDNFPSDHFNNDGTAFWSGQKRCPHILNFDPNEEICVDFLISVVKIILKSLV